MAADNCISVPSDVTMQSRPCPRQIQQGSVSASPTEAPAACGRAHRPLNRPAIVRLVLLLARPLFTRLLFVAHLPTKCVPGSVCFVLVYFCCFLFFVVLSFSCSNCAASPPLFNRTAKYREVGASPLGECV